MHSPSETSCLNKIPAEQENILLSTSVLGAGVAGLRCFNETVKQLS
jgi:hypothetical protein